MANWQEREKRIDQEKIQRENREKLAKQSWIDNILNRVSVRTILDEIRTDMWREGRIREITEKEKDGFEYRTGLELVAKVSTLLVLTSPRWGKVWHSYGASDGLPSSEGYHNGIVNYGNEVAVGDIEVSLKITVGEYLHYDYHHSEGFVSVLYPKTDTTISIEDTPLMKRDDLVQFERKDYSDKSTLWFPLLEEDHYEYTKSRNSSEVSTFQNLGGMGHLIGDFEEEITKYVKRRRDTENFPFQMRERANRLIAKSPYKKVVKGINLIKYLHRRGANGYRLDDVHRDFIKDIEDK